MYGTFWETTPLKTEVFVWQDAVCASNHRLLYVVLSTSEPEYMGLEIKRWGRSGSSRYYVYLPTCTILFCILATLSFVDFVLAPKSRENAFTRGQKVPTKLEDEIATRPYWALYATEPTGKERDCYSSGWSDWSWLQRGNLCYCYKMRAEGTISGFQGIHWDVSSFHGQW